ncbi:hypothetical protein MMC07_003203 [Pseudocyphellaria aurata]|nr:hypothetical protein [Pseudocyphellaria aurata]
MDVPSESSRLEPNANRPTSPSRPDLFIGGGNRRIANQSGELRRGHSDGEVLSNGPVLYNTRTTDALPRDGETWVDFLRQSSSAAHDPDERSQVATRKAAFMAADRKRRLTGQQEEYSRRRSASSLTFGQTASDRIRQSVAQSTSGYPDAMPSTSAESRLGSRLTDRPLPPRPIRTTSQSRRSTDIPLPRWQPDAEVSRCPICGSNFNFWYRKHHCRKCGRVVCANCSPHRITIPRQFIVHPPSDYSQDINPGSPTGPPVIDLTGDNEVDVATPTSSVTTRRQSHDNPLNSGLGGGQEVRLCNPCVPDPNPLPHLSFPSPGPYSFNSFPTPGNLSRTVHYPQHPLRPAVEPQRGSAFPSRPESERQRYHPRNDPESGLNQERQPANSRFVGASASASSHPQSQTSHPPGLPPPRYASVYSNYTSTYGSAPDSSVHERYPGSLLREQQTSHHRHGHHASVGSASASSRHRPTPDMVAPLPARAAAQLVLREEDECPICHKALPPRGPDGSEVAREAHVTACIESHFSPPTPQASRPLPSAATQAAVAASAAVPFPVGGRYVSHRAEGPQDRASVHAMPRRRTTGMVVYHASEKDCVSEDGGAQECVICFDEFSVGVEMGRLECLCKFHKACIRQWWDTKGVGACPVHQDGI